MSDDGDKVLAGIGSGVLVVIFAPLIVAPFALLDGWVLVNMWRWFVEPLHVAPLRLWSAVGLGLTIALVTKQYSHDERKALDRFLGLIIFPMATLFFGYLVHLIAR